MESPQGCAKNLLGLIVYEAARLKCRQGCNEGAASVMARDLIESLPIPEPSPLSLQPAFLQLIALWLKGNFLGCRR